MNSYDFEHLEPKSGAPILKPLFCPVCNGTGKASSFSVQNKVDGIRRSIQEWNSMNYEKWITTIDKETIDYYKEKEATQYNFQKMFVDLKQYASNIHETELRKCSDYLTLSKAFEGMDESLCPFCLGTGKGRTMTEIYSRDGASFLKETDKFGFVRGFWQYSYQIPAHPMWFNRDEIIYIMATPRSMSPYGYAPTQAILDVVKSLYYSTQYNIRYFTYNAIPDGVLSILDTSEPEMKRIRDYWKNEIAGQPHKLPMMNKKAEFTPFQMSSREMDFLQSQQWYFKLVISAFKLTPAELGFTEDVNRATGGTQAEVVRRRGIRPWLDLIEYVINDQLLPEFGTIANGIKFKFVVKDPVEEMQKRELDKTMLELGLTTINEIRTRDGLDPVSWGDAPMGMSFGGSYGNSPFGGKPGESNNPEEGQEKPREDKKDEEQKPKENKDEETNKSLPVQPIGQYYNDPLISFRPGHKPEQPSPQTSHPVDPGKIIINSKPSQLVSPFGDAFARCPSCGFNSLTLDQSPDDIHQGQEVFVCTRCHGKFVKKTGQQTVTEENSEQFVSELMQRVGTNETEPKVVTNPVWSPKGEPQMDLAKFYSDHDTIEKYVGWPIDSVKEYIIEFLKKYDFNLIEDFSEIQKMKLRDILTRGIVLGKPITSMAKELDNLLKNEPRSFAIIRTEVIRASNEGRLKFFKNRKVENVEWVTAPLEDARLCDKCKEHNGKIYTLKSAYGKIPAHTHCRCNFVAAD